jgi:hypothetical protein
MTSKPHKSQQLNALPLDNGVWEAIRAIADALLVRGHLSKDEANCCRASPDKPYFICRNFSNAGRLCLLYIVRFQLHRAETVYPAVDIMISGDKPDVFHLGANLN